MAGNPERRRREREAVLAAHRAAGRAKPRAKSSDVATRRATVERAAKIGDAAAAVEAGVSTATVRSWRRRLKAEAASTAAVTPSSVDMPPTPADGDAVAQMRSTAGLARDLAEEAARQSQGAMRGGEAVKVRELSASAKMWAATAASLEQASAVAESTEIRLTERQNQMVAAHIKDFCAAVGVPLTPGTRRVLRALLEAGEEGADLNSPDVEQAAREVRAHFRQLLAAELAAELPPPSEDEAEAAIAEPDIDVAIEPSSPTAVEEAVETGDIEPDDGLPPWDELPDGWKEKYKLQPDRGRHEYANAIRREELAPARAPSKPSRYGALTHPGLR